MGGGYSPLYKEPFVYFIGSAATGYWGVYVCGGSVKLLRLNKSENDDVAGYYLYRSSWSRDVELFNIDVLSPVYKTFTSNLVSLYGELPATVNDNGNTLTVLGRNFSIQNIVLEDEFALFDYAGLCEGVTFIYDEEGESTIAAGAYCNGLLHLFCSVDEDDVERAFCNIGIDNQSDSYPSFRETFEDTGIYWAASDFGYDKDAITQLLTSRGVNVVWHTMFVEDSQDFDTFTLAFQVSETNIYK